MNKKINSIFLILALGLPFSLAIDNNYAKAEVIYNKTVETETVITPINEANYKKIIKKDLNDELINLNKLIEVMTVEQKNASANKKKEIGDFITIIKIKKDKSEDTLKKIDTDFDSILKDKVNEFQKTIDQEINRFDKEAKAIKISKIASDLNKSKKEMQDHLNNLKIMGLGGYEEARTYVIQIKKGFEKEMEKKLDALDKRIDKIQNKVLIMANNNSKDKMLDKLSDLKNTRDDIKRRIRESKASSVDNWNDARVVIINLFDKFEDQINKLGNA
jgi:hypothetical protein